MVFESLIIAANLALDWIAFIIILYGAFVAAVSLFAAEAKQAGRKRWRQIRQEFTHRIVFALEFFIAGDILRTILMPSQEELTRLAIIVAIRIALGYFLEKEAEA